MPTPAAEPKRLQVIDRIVAVLSAVTAGASYWYTPGQVKKRFVHWAEAKQFPAYAVSEASGGTVEYCGAVNNYDEIFYVSVKGIVRDESDTVTKLNRCIRDVRKAINDDSIGTAAGTLAALAVETRMEEPPETDDGYLAVEGFGFFDLRVRIRITGTYDEL